MFLTMRISVYRCFHEHLFLVEFSFVSLSFYYSLFSLICIVYSYKIVKMDFCCEFREILVLHNHGWFCSVELRVEIIRRIVKSNKDIHNLSKPLN